MLHKLTCIVANEDTTFTVTVNGDQTVQELKEAIKRERADLDVPTVHLTLYQSNVDISNEDQYDEVVRGISPDQFRDKKLNPAYRVSRYFGEVDLPEMMVHILVDLPRERKRKPSTDVVTNSANIYPALIFSAKEMKVFNYEMLESNHITSETLDPDFIKLIKTKLQAQRSMEAADQEILKRNFGGNLNMYFKAVDGDGNVDCSYEETTLYVSPFLHFPGPSSLEVGDAIACLGYYFRSLGAYLCKSSPGWFFRSEGYWPFKLVGRVDETLYSYHPRSDFLCLLGGYPYLLIEVCSDKQQQLDRYRMLLQAGQLVRVMNSFKDVTEEPFKSFIVVAVYLNRDSVAERYLVYQEERDSPRVRYSKDRFNLATPIGTFEFLFELHNLPSALPADPDLPNASGRLARLNQDVNNACLGGFTTKKTKRREQETNHSNTAPPGRRMSGPFGDQFTVHKLSSAGYQVLPEPEIEDWTPLNPLKPTLSRAKRSTGEVVMLKLVSLDEFTIHSFLDSIKSECNHTIPILDQVALGMEIIVAMPSEMVLAHAPASVLETRGNVFAHQFLEGVRFMHQQHVAHLDLKPDNLLITATARLMIIDFSISVRVIKEEDWIQGYRGTEGWVAPEVNATKYQPIRADLWSAGKVLQYLACHQHTGVIETLANNLLRRDPQHRPLLSKIDLPCQEVLGLKRKLGVEEGEKEGIKRKCSGSGVIPQNALAIPASLPTP